MPKPKKRAAPPKLRSAPVTAQSNATAIAEYVRECMRHPSIAKKIADSSGHVKVVVTFGNDAKYSECSLILDLCPHDLARIKAEVLHNAEIQNLEGDEKAEFVERMLTKRRFVFVSVNWSSTKESRWSVWPLDTPEPVASAAAPPPPPPLPAKE